MLKSVANMAFFCLLLSAAQATQPFDFKEPWPAPAFEHRDLHDRQHRLDDFRGTVLVVNFWATWCPPCVKEMPSLQRAWQALREQGVQVLGINLGEDRDTIEDFAERHGIEFPLLLDESMGSSPAWRLKGLPTTHIVDADGQVAATVIGEKEWDDPAILQWLKALVPSPSSSPQK